MSGNDVDRPRDAASGGATILVVDDNADNRAYLTSLLTHLGHHVVEAADGVEGLAAAARVRPDLIIVDMVMPIVDGFEFTRRLRVAPDLSGTRVVFHTATFDDREIRSLADTLGVLDQIPKPAEPETILAIVRRVLELPIRRVAPPAEGVFDREHQRILADKLARKVEELEILSDRLRSILDATAEGIIGVDLDGLVTFANPTASSLLGSPTDALIGEDFSARIHLPPADGMDGAADGGTVRAAIRDGRSRDVTDARFARQDGGVVTVDYVVAPLHERGQIVGGVVAFRDATARRAAQEAGVGREAAEAANRAKSDFLSRMSHDLRTPLNAVLGFAQLLELDDLTPEQRENAGYIARAGRHLLELINEVLDISRIEAGQLAISPEPVGVEDLINELVALIGPQSAEQGITVEASDPGCGRYVLADPQRLKQVVLNLLSNAVKYNRPGGAVSISCRLASPERLRIEVDDTGFGIRPDSMNRLFRPFERLGAEHGDIEGTGMGLAISKGLVEAMGGRIGVESTPDVGSTFWIELELSEDPLEADERRVEPSPSSTAAVPAQPGPKWVVLYVEDNPSNLLLVERILERRPSVELHSAMQGGLALELARILRPDLILLDAHLPDMPGSEVLGTLKRDPATSGIPIVIVSADATPSHVRRLTEDGASDYLTKPLDIERFLQVIDTTLGGPGSPP